MSGYALWYVRVCLVEKLCRTAVGASRTDPIVNRVYRDDYSTTFFFTGKERHLPSGSYGNGANVAEDIEKTEDILSSSA